jgi:hypothetical protein
MTMKKLFPMLKMTSQKVPGKSAKLNRPVGRPSAYRPEFCQMMDAFFDIPLEKEVAVDIEDGKGGRIKEIRIVVNPFPTFARFAARIGVSRESLRNWSNAKNPDGTPTKPEFFCAYARARDLQESLLIEGGMSGVYDCRFAILTAKNILGWRDCIEQDIEVRIKAATVAELDRIYEEGMRRSKDNRRSMAGSAKRSKLI